MTIPRGTSLLHSVFIPIFADDWKQLSTVAIAYFPLSEWWMWSHLSYCTEVPNSVDNEGLSICAMDRAHQKGWIKASRKAIIPLACSRCCLWWSEFKARDFSCCMLILKTWSHLTSDLIATQISFISKCSLNMSCVNKVWRPEGDLFDHYGSMHFLW